MFSQTRLSGTALAKALVERTNAVNLMKLEIPFLAALGAVGTPLLARAAVQGVEFALLSAAIQACLKVVRGARRLSISW
jgi:hypothetical protein